MKYPDLALARVTGALLGIGVGVFGYWVQLQYLDYRASPVRRIECTTNIYLSANSDGGWTRCSVPTPCPEASP